MRAARWHWHVQCDLDPDSAATAGQCSGQVRAHWQSAPNTPGRGRPGSPRRRRPSGRRMGGASALSAPPARSTAMPPIMITRRRPGGRIGGPGPRRGGAASRLGRVVCHWLAVARTSAWPNCMASRQLGRVVWGHVVVRPAGATTCTRLSRSFSRSSRLRFSPFLSESYLAEAAVAVRPVSWLCNGARTATIGPSRPWS